MNSKIFALIFFAIFGSGTAFAKNSLDLGLVRSQALFHAIDQFKADGNQLTDYRLVIEDRESLIEIIFVPPVISGKDPWKAKPSTLPEVHYYLDANGKAVLRKAFGK